MDRFCQELLPGLLIEVCKVSAPDAAAVASDIRLRAEAVAHLDQATRETLAAPFFEDSSAYDPADASPWMKALTTLVVRNSLLEELHSNGPVETGGIISITTYALAPLSHLFGARRREPLPGGVVGDMFAGLAVDTPVRGRASPPSVKLSSTGAGAWGTKCRTLLLQTCRTSLR